MIQLILSQEHSDGHPGISKMVNLINKKYYGITVAMIKEFVNSCDSCRNFLPMRTLQDLTIVDIRKKYDRYVIDCVDLRHYSDMNDGYCWILNVVDSFTKFLWSFKLKNKTALAVAECLRECFITFGVPVSIQADNGKEFKNRILNELCTEMNIQMIHGRPRNPKAQGVVERVNQTIKRWLAKVLHGSQVKRWIDYLNKVVYKYNTTVHRATGQSPFLLFHGQLGYNSSIVIPEIDDTGSEIRSVLVDDENSFNDISAQWNLEIQNNSIVAEELPEESIEVVNPDMIRINNNALAHFDEYRTRVIYDANSNNTSRTFSSGDFILVKNDFDHNTLTRRNPFDSFYEDDIYEVVEILQNNMLKIKKVGSSETLIVFKGRVKKLN